MSWKITNLDTGENIFFDLNSDKRIIHAHPDNEVQTFIGRHAKNDVGPKIRQNMKVSFSEVPAFTLLTSGKGTIHNLLLPFARKQNLPIKKSEEFTVSSHGLHVIVAGHPVLVVSDSSQTQLVSNLSLSCNLLCVGGDSELAEAILSKLEEAYSEKYVRAVSNPPIDNRPRVR